MSTTPTYELELRAAEQRKRLHNSVEELKYQVRDKLNIKRNVRQYMLAASGVASLMGLVLGYGFAGMFTKH
jgi:hypothetical protein